MPKVSPKPVMSYSLTWLVTPGCSSPKPCMPYSIWVLATL